MINYLADWFDEFLFGFTYTRLTFRCWKILINDDGESFDNNKVFFEFYLIGIENDFIK